MMDFRATPMSVVMLLLVALALAVLVSLFRRKLDSNVPLLFYCAVIVYMSATGRDLNTLLFLCGLFAALILRFEFMNRSFMNVFWAVEVLAVAGIALRFLSEAFNIRY